MVSGLRDEVDQAAHRMLDALHDTEHDPSVEFLDDPARENELWQVREAGDMVFVETLAGLDRLPPRGAWFLFLPLNLVDGTGAPGRALAVLP
jgi:kynurenine formamidase